MLQATDKRSRTITLSIPALPLPSGFMMACIGAFLLVLAAYANSLHNGFHFDDAYSIERNLFIRDLRNVPRFFTDANTFSSFPSNADYRPIVTLTLALDYWLGGGLNPIAFHITQLALFAGVGVLLFLFCLALFESSGAAGASRWPALFAATLFCVHTGNTQVANYISARSELLSTIGVLGAFVLYLYAPQSRRRHLYLVPMVVGALAKSPAVMFAPLLLVYKLLIEEQLSVRDVFSRASWPRVRDALRSTAPAFILAISLFVFVEAMNGASQSYGGGARMQYLETQTWVWLRYARLFFIPTGLSADTDLTLFTTWQDPRVLLGVLFALGSAVVLWRASTSRELRPCAFGLAWFWLGLLPASSIFPLAEVTNDHRMFLPFVGLAAAATWWSATRIRSLRARMTPAHQRTLIVAACATSIVLLMAHVAATRARNRVWLNEETLWADVIAKSPLNGRGWMNYGLSQMRLARYARAKQLFEHAQALAPSYAVLEVNLGVVTDAMNDAGAAQRHFERALALAPNYSGAHLYYARWLVEHQQAPDAILQLRRAITLSPGDIDARELLMNIHAARGSVAELKSLATETLRLAASGTLANAYATDTFPFAVPAPSYQHLFQLGLGFTRERRHLEAAQAYRAALGFDGGSTDALNNLGWSLAQVGFFEEAIAAYQQALRLQPDLARARNNLTIAVNARSDALRLRAARIQLAGAATQGSHEY